MIWSKADFVKVCESLERYVNKELEEMFAAMKRDDIRFVFQITEHAIERAHKRLCNDVNAMDRLVMLVRGMIKNAMCLIMYHRTKYVDRTVVPDLRLKYDAFTAPFMFTERAMRLMTWYEAPIEFYGANIISTKTSPG